MLTKERPEMNMSQAGGGPRRPLHARRPASSERGSAMVEFALVSPLLFLLMVVSFDCGLYAYAFVSVQNGARVAALRNSSGVDSAADQATACSMVLQELKGLPSSSMSGNCGGVATVSTTLLCASGCAAGQGSPDGQPAAQVTVTYAMPSVFQLHIPGGSSITRTAQMRIRGIQ